ncbi:hypothetical protein [Escherichia coli]|uniref:hypothetical protein n=1 Tax=Escherichia coli TaxID=562 RepID=UPI003D9FDDBE
MGRQAQAFFRGMAERRFLAAVAGRVLRPVLLAQLPDPVVVARMTLGLPVRHLPVVMVLLAWRSWKNSRNGLHSCTTIDVISPPLHHLPALIEILSMVVNSTNPVH